jgi:ferredoxin
MFGFGHVRELFEEGYRATLDALDALGPGFDDKARGIFPRRNVEVRIDPELCCGCGACVMHAPQVFAMDRTGKAVVREPLQSWSPIDGAYVRNCPTYAISARLAPPPSHS